MSTALRCHKCGYDFSGSGDSAHVCLQQPRTQPKQEQDKPVAVVTGMYGGRFTYAPIKSSVVLPVGTALYTHPQQRTWVELTQEETYELWQASRCGVSRYLNFASLIDAKLKEKNNG